MSLLSSTQGTPERVWSLVSCLAACDGSLETADAAEWLNPGFVRDRGVKIQEKPDAVNQTLNAAASIGAVEATDGIVRLNPVCRLGDFRAFCDWVHDRLVRLDSREKDAVILETYAWMAVESDRQGNIGWVHDWANARFADAAEAALPEGADDDGANRINSTKLPAWRRWLSCLGLIVPMPPSMQAHPAAGRRAARELERAEFPKGREVRADEFLRVMASRLPYLDGGRMFAEAAKRIGHAPSQRHLSPLLSAALRDLHEEGFIELQLRGDAADLFHLAKGTHKVPSFHSVVIHPGETT